MGMAFSKETSLGLGLVRGPKHLDELEEVAAWLDANEFSCTLSVSNGTATLDIEMTSDDEGPAARTQEKFEQHAMQAVILALAKHLG